MRITRGKLRPRITYPNDRPAIEHVIWMALVLGPASMDKAHFVVLAKPGRAA